MVGTLARSMAESDLDLVRRLLAGDGLVYTQVRRDVERAFGQAFSRVSRRWPGLDAHEADLLQSLELHLVRDDYRVLGTFRGDARLSTWLYAVAMRHVSQEAERLARRHAHELSAPLPERADVRTDPERDAVEASERAHVRRAVEGLSDDERYLLALFFEQGLDASEVSRILGLGAAAVRMRKKRLLSKLEKKLKECK